MARFVFPEPPDAPDELGFVATPEPPDLLRDERGRRILDARVKQFVGGLGLSERLGAAPRLVGDVVVAEVPPNSVEVYPASAAARFLRDLGNKEEPATSGKLPDDEEARARAARVVADLGMDGEGVRYSYVDHTLVQVSVGKPARGSVAERALRPSLALVRLGTRVGAPYAIETHVNYRYSVGKLRVEGPGAQLQVSFGTTGEVTTVLAYWRTPESSKPRVRGAPKPYKGLLRQLEEDPRYERLSDDAVVTFEGIYLSYYAAPPQVVQSELVPVYVCRGTVEAPLGDGTHTYPFVRYVAATHMESDDWKRAGPALEELITA